MTVENGRLAFAARALGRAGAASEWLVRRRWNAQSASRLRSAMGQGARVGRDVHLNGLVDLRGGKGLVLGNNVHIGHGCTLQADGGLAIGAHSHLSRYITIYSVTHEYEGERLPYDAAVRERPVVIGVAVWIGQGATVLPGTQLGDGVIVGAGAVVHGHVEDGAIIMASAARQRGARDMREFVRRRSAQAWAGKGGERYVSRD